MKILNYISKNKKGQQHFAIFFVIVGTLIALGITITFWDNEASLYRNIGPGISIPVGLLCVYYLGIQRNFGNFLGILANINEIIVNAMFNNFGFVVSASYFFLSHIIGAFEWNKNKDENNVTRVRDANSTNGKRMIFGFLVIATIFVLLNWSQGWIVAQTPLLFWLNIIVMYLSIIAQGAMVMRFRYAWWVWFSVNLFAIPTQFISGNYIFGIMYIFYQINCIIALYAQYTTDVKE